MGGQKKFYNRWLSITEKTKLLNECKLVSSVFASLNFAIKSVSDIAFVDNKDIQIKEKALIQLFKNLSANVKILLETARVALQPINYIKIHV